MAAVVFRYRKWLERTATWSSTLSRNSRDTNLRLASSRYGELVPESKRVLVKFEG